MPTNSIDLLWAIISASALGVVLVSTILALLYINQRKVIATQRENLHQLEERELKYRNLFENSLVAMFRIELMNGTILESNNLFLKTLGTATKEEASKLFQSQNIAALNSITEAVQKQGIIEHFETPFKRSDGTTIWTSLSAKHFPAEGYIEGMMIDITEKKNLERQFLRAQRMEGIGILASGIAHDLNNVLSPIILAIGLLKDKYVDEMSQRILASIQKTAQRGADIIKQVLSFARGVEVEKTPIKPASLVKDIAQIVSGTFPKSLIIKTTIEKNLPDILGDPTQLQQVLLNLCVNARDAMTNSGVVTITVSFIIVNESFRKRNIEATADQYVVLSVSDTGSGIPENILGRIFDPFFTTKEIGKGTGLGLSTVHAIVKGHHGFITVDSELEKGTTFYVHLPAAPVTVSREAVTVKKEP